MRERPILFSAPMVRVILDGRKTQTRRVLKDAHATALLDKWETDLGSPATVISAGGFGGAVFVDKATGGTCSQPLRCPYGQPGDRLWIKETWRTSVACDPLPPTRVLGHGWPTWYEADGAVIWNGATSGGPAFTTPGKTRVSIHMPRAFSRITLEVTAVRVERLHAISEEDARAEGVDWAAPEPHGERWDDDREDPREVGYSHAGASFARDNFRRLWDSINGKPRPMLNDDGEPVLDDNERPIMVAPKSWASNPWVWVVKFRRLEAEDRAA